VAWLTKNAVAEADAVIGHDLVARGRQASMELASKAPRDSTDAVIIVPPMNKSIKFTLLVKPLDSHLQPE
jgi:hypothetical protein